MRWSQKVNGYHLSWHWRSRVGNKCNRWNSRTTQSPRRASRSLHSWWLQRLAETIKLRQFPVLEWPKAQGLHPTKRPRIGQVTYEIWRTHGTTRSKVCVHHPLSYFQPYNNTRHAAMVHWLRTENWKSKAQRVPRPPQLQSADRLAPRTSFLQRVRDRESLHGDTRKL